MRPKLENNVFSDDDDDKKDMPQESSNNNNNNNNQNQNQVTSAPKIIRARESIRPKLENDVFSDEVAPTPPPRRPSLLTGPIKTGDESIQVFENPMARNLKPFSNNTNQGHSEDIESTLTHIKAYFEGFDDLSTIDVANIIMKYNKVYSLYVDRFSQMSMMTRLDWAVNIVLRPAFFDDDLISRINNTMLVSALLVSISASNFISPPYQEMHEDNYRGYSYILFIATIFFLLSIFLGVFFVDNMSRAYNDKDRYSSFPYLALIFPHLVTYRLITITENYTIFNSAQHCMFVGTIFLIFSLILSSSFNFVNDDTYVFTFAVVSCVFGLAYVGVTMHVSTAGKQSDHNKFFRDHIINSNGYVREELLNTCRKIIENN